MDDIAVICAGHVNWDVTLSIDRLPEPDGEGRILDQRQSGGGSASNTAAVLASLDVDTSLLGCVGDDRLGSLVRRELGESGVDCSPLEQARAGPTTVKYLVVDERGEVMVFANEGVNEAFAATDLPPSHLDAATHLHLTGQDPETARRLAEKATAAGVAVSFDPGRRLGSRPFAPVLDSVDVLFLNDAERKSARDRGLLEDHDGTVVCKRGNSGAEVRVDGKRTVHEGYDVEPLDTAGAGDAFAAGFLAARLQDLTDSEALAVGNACGAVAVQSAGARTKLSWADVGQYIEDDVPTNRET